MLPKPCIFAIVSARRKHGSSKPNLSASFYKPHGSQGNRGQGDVKRKIKELEAKLKLI